LKVPIEIRWNEKVRKEGDKDWNRGKKTPAALDWHHNLYGRGPGRLESHQAEDKREQFHSKKGVQNTSGRREDVEEAGKG